MATWITDPVLLAQYNAGLPPDEHAGGYWQLNQHEIEEEARKEARWQSDRRLREWYQERAFWQQARAQNNF